MALQFLPLEFHVCELIHTNPSQFLRLESACSILLSYPSNHIDNTADEIRELLSYHRLWINRGEGLNLSVNIVENGNLWSTFEMKDLINILGTYFLDSEVLWLSSMY